MALIVAGGRGLRFGGALAKQYRNLAGQPVLRHTVSRFREHRRVTAVRVVIGEADRDLYDAATVGLDLLAPVIGGVTRQQSALRGLESLRSHAPDLVLIHDAARPLCPREVIDRVVEALDSWPAAVPAIAVGDTLKRAVPFDGDAGAGGGLVSATVERTGLWRAQTPQGFRFAPILAAHRRFADEDCTDDAAVAERAGLPVRIVAGDEVNMKITAQEDLRRAERELSAARPSDSARTSLTESRTGIGFDVHRFKPGERAPGDAANHVVLGGIAIPHDASLLGHSDADVALHALTDAVLGAIGAGDIGSHFPPSDPKWQRADSTIFLRHAADLVADSGGQIVHVDLVVICERPRIGPYRDAIVERIAGVLGIEAGRVSVKATTTEHLGFTGRGEGIAAQALATVQLKSSL